MKRIIFYAIVSIFSLHLACAQSLPEVTLDQAWKDKIRALAPEKATFPAKKKKVLVFSLHTGFDHWVRPHTEEMVKILGEKSGVFSVTGSKDIAMMELKNLQKFDVLVLNNTNSKPDHRNLFWDKLKESGTDSALVMQQALALEANLRKFVENGGGLFVLHGANTMLNNSWEFSRLIGGSFDYHPKQQAIQVRLEDPKHPLVQAFPAEGFNHVDEPYFYKNAYAERDFKPLLYFNNAEIEGQRKGQELTEGKTYVAWIRTEGKGKVMYISPSHNAQSFENPDLLQFYLDGMQYVAGDVECDETPIKK
ncbi:ThuA domain-containing protein [Algoriphagus boritolerans]|uniref:Trehalose utilisation n=1 Tax=Algoriphagus boritolerans DSM 17298 = JCM 18970 TaxID=1120964 RepID=A0A1H5TQY9_9BACT|nr:ThuA domain-containing protein [Algoriphagus boritolerans]SEF65282.1 Trehalose utilisation [Algoriphagus boritolerans DSM 17298 = JCM 18970]